VAKIFTVRPPFVAYYIKTLNGWEFSEIAKKSSRKIVGQCETINVEEKNDELRCIIE
jgi:hypothetical protein